MEVRQCPRCKKIFQYVSGPPICPECKSQDEKDFDRIKQYLKDNPKAALADVADELEISIEKITKFLKEGRLEIAASSPIKLECEKCGRLIPSGKYCKSCMSELESNLKGSYNELKEKGSTAGSLMRFLRNEEDKK